MLDGSLVEPFIELLEEINVSFLIFNYFPFVRWGQKTQLSDVVEDEGSQISGLVVFYLLSIIAS